MTRNRFTVARPGPRHEAFTVVELLVSVFVLGIIVFFVAQLMTSATAITRPGNKHLSTDTQGRVVLDRIALDFAQMLKRTDVDYYLKQPTGYIKGNGHGWGRKIPTGQPGSDQMAFFTQVPGYYPPSGAQSPISLVSYRVNQGSSTGAAYMRLERLGKGLRSNGYDPGTGNSQIYPMIFATGQITGCSGGPCGAWAGPWAPAINNNTTCGGGSANNSCDSNYEIIGPGVFRVEYYYILKNGLATDVPWDKFTRTTQTSITSPVPIGLTDVEAIGVVIAAIDPEGRALMDANASNPGGATMLDLVSDLADFATAPGRGIGNQNKYIGGLEASWETTIDQWASTGQTSIPSSVPRAVASRIKIYSRIFDLKTLPTF